MKMVVFIKKEGKFPHFASLTFEFTSGYGAPAEKCQVQRFVMRFF
jgi:hypothetical protein